MHIKFQTSDSTKTPMPRRMAGYIGRLIEAHGVPVYAFVIYLRPDAGANDPGLIDEKLWGLLPFALLMEPPKDTPLEEWFRECVRAVDQLGLAPIDKADFLVYLLTLGGLVYDSQTLFNIISEETMYESSIAQHFAERGRREGIEQGIQQGLMLAVLDVISERFSPNRAEQLKPTLESIQEIARLREILVKASEVETFDKLQQAVDTLIS